jgi:proteic killer suppression protein
MIKSFKHRGLERFFKTGSKAGIQPASCGEAARHSYVSERSYGDRSGIWMFRDGHCIRFKGNSQDYWAVKVNGNWRVTFRFEKGDAEIVDYRDYH